MRPYDIRKMYACQSVNVTPGELFEKSHDEYKKILIKVDHVFKDYSIF